eukprot:TRINITY_DN15571_c1_g2_i1.p1 TRINITY_DN15571_c1_g2~~TRINITY_DN15571_c1_g2_i1.p1  ORF type:complete len:537 (+),score=113.87 TRINITY_DN15571_c1_g2_i1:56-1612(+)
MDAPLGAHRSVLPMRNGLVLLLDSGSLGYCARLGAVGAVVVGSTDAAAEIAAEADRESSGAFADVRHFPADAFTAGSLLQVMHAVCGAADSITADGGACVVYTGEPAVAFDDIGPLLTSVAIGLEMWADARKPWEELGRRHTDAAASVCARLRCQQPGALAQDLAAFGRVLDSALLAAESVGGGSVPRSPELPEPSLRTKIDELRTERALLRRDEVMATVWEEELSRRIESHSPPRRRAPVERDGGAAAMLPPPSPGTSRRPIIPVSPEAVPPEATPTPALPQPRATPADVSVPPPCAAEAAPAPAAEARMTALTNTMRWVETAAKMTDAAIKRAQAEPAPAHAEHPAHMHPEPAHPEPAGLPAYPPPYPEPPGLPAAYAAAAPHPHAAPAPAPHPNPRHWLPQHLWPSSSPPRAHAAAAPPWYQEAAAREDPGRRHSRWGEPAPGHPNKKVWVPLTYFSSDHPTASPEYSGHGGMSRCLPRPPLNPTPPPPPPPGSRDHVVMPAVPDRGERVERLAR